MAEQPSPNTDEQAQSTDQQDDASNNDELATWLKRIDLEKYESALRAHHINKLSDFKVLTEEPEIETVAADVGIDNIIQKKKFINAVKDHNGIKEAKEASEEVKIPDVPDGGLKDPEKMDKPNIEPDEQKKPTTGSDEVGDIVYLEDLSNDDKKDLFRGTRALLQGRCIKSGADIQTSPYPLFVLSKDIKFDDHKNIGIMQPKNAKHVVMNESYSAAQRSITESGYYSNSAQGGVAEIGGLSSEVTVSTEKQEITTKTRISFTASSRMYKGEIVIDGRSVEYNPEFLHELQELLDKKIKDEAKWTALTDKYGQFYITKCALGGSAYSTKEETVSDQKEREKTSTKIKAAFEASINGKSGGAGIGHGQNEEDEYQKIDKKSTLSLSCHGGEPSLCSFEDFGRWEASVNKSYKLWDIIEVKDIKSFYYLLDEEKQIQIKALMPKKAFKAKWDISKPTNIAISYNGKYLYGDSNSSENIKTLSFQSDKIGYDEKFKWIPISEEKGGGHLEHHSGDKVTKHDAGLVMVENPKDALQKYTSMDPLGIGVAAASSLFFKNPMNLIVVYYDLWIERFEVEEKNKGYTFKVDNIYVSAKEDGSTVLKAKDALENETFNIEVLG